MQIRKPCLSQARILLVVIVIALCSLPTLAQDLTYLALQGPGQASVAIDRTNKVAYIIDLGRSGDGDYILIERMALLDRLAEQGVKRLVFTCSHPHADHMGGIRALFSKPRAFFKDDQLINPRFQSIWVIDDGVSESLFSLLRRSIPLNNLLQLHHKSASNINAFADLSKSQDEVFIENIPYKIASNAGPHGRAIVTRIRLGRKHSILDFDDADSSIIHKVVAELKRRGITNIDSFVVPHHGSAYHDIEPILELNPKRAIIPVNPGNRYGHPAPPILLALMKKLGSQNVLFTGSVEHIVLDPNGIKHASHTAAQRDSYALFVLPNRVKAEKRGITKDVQEAYDEIRSLMFNDPGMPLPKPGNLTPGPGQRGPSSTLIEQRIGEMGSMHPQEFEIGFIAVGRTEPLSLRHHNIFPTNLGGQDVSVTVNRAAKETDEPDTKLNVTEAQSATQQLMLLGIPTDKATKVHIHFDTEAGFNNGLEPGQMIPREELVKPGSPMPEGGMVFLRGGKLFPVGSASELLGGTLDVCGVKLCVRTPGEGINLDRFYELPFLPDRLFSEVWTRTYDHHIDAFYLSINPTKDFLRDLDRRLTQVPSDKLLSGVGSPGLREVAPSRKSKKGKKPTAEDQVDIRSHEVVTTGDIWNSEIGSILWQADVAFKSAALGFDVLTGVGTTSFQRSPFFLASQVPGKEEELQVASKNRWCRLYWASGQQNIKVAQAPYKVSFEGNAVIARSEPMELQNGALRDTPLGTWCGDTKQLAAELQREANSGKSQYAILNQLKELAEIQSFALWARENRLAVSDRFRQSIKDHQSSSGSPVPQWTSGIRTTPRVLVQEERHMESSTFTEQVHISLADMDIATKEKCLLKPWNKQFEDFPKAGYEFDKSTDTWRKPGEEIRGEDQFISNWMTELARKIAICAGADLLIPHYMHVTQVKNQEFGIVFHPQTIHMHGGVLLEPQPKILGSAGWNKEMLIAPNGRILFRRVKDDLHFWNLIDNHPQFGSILQHVVIRGGSVTAANAQDGRLRFIVETKPGAVVRHELRVAQSSTFTKGVEWAEARHGTDGSLILAKAVWPCAGSEARESGCVAAADIEFNALGPLMSTDGKGEPALLTHQIDENTWAIELNLSNLLPELEYQGQSTSPSTVDSQLFMIRAYARWGFIREASEKYRQLAEKFEGRTQDTILSRELSLPGLSTKDNDFPSRLLNSDKEARLKDIQNRSITVDALFRHLDQAEEVTADLPPRVASEFWRLQVDLCEAAENRLGMNQEQRDHLLREKSRYRSLMIRNQFLADGLSNPWRLFK